MRRLYQTFKYSDAIFCIRYIFPTSRLYKNFKSIGPTVLPTEQLKVANFVSTNPKNGLSQLKNFLYSLLILLNLNLISFWTPSAKQGCHFN
ncbi:hypothetical protein O3M35_001433 [Rhynocoris fuscipes]|uniref:Uncharacterized protein n=1 Tax=Rhynocoris fuscipes TaxID=488301 RepID=A0AAW1CMF4_9HEMI